MKITFRKRAEPDTVFAKDVFASQIGKVVPLRLGDADMVSTCRVVGAEVSDDGTEARLTVEILGFGIGDLLATQRPVPGADPLLAADIRASHERLRGMSIGWRT